MRDEKGNLVPVLGLSFEDFERLLRLSRGLAQPPQPDFVIARLTASGTVQGELATLQLKLAVQVRADGWVAVPIDLRNGIMGREQHYAGPGEFFLAPTAGGPGYTCWLKGRDTKPHEISFSATFPVRVEDDALQLAAALPPATESLLSLKFSEPISQPRLASGAGILATTGATAGNTEVEVLGVSGDFELHWTRGAVSRAGARQRLEANGEVTVRIESQQRVTSEARLRVRSLGQPLTRFIVELPAGMELAPGLASSEYSLSELTEGQTSTATPARQRIAVELSRPTVTAAEVILRAQRLPAANLKAPFGPADFVVENALRQRGTIEFLSEGDWQLDWSNDQSVHRLDVGGEPGNPQIAARFEYFRQPCELALRVAARPSRLSIEPTHMVYVDTNQSRIETLLKCRFRGARAEGLRLQLGQWKFDRLTPDALFELPVVQPNGEVLVPFRNGAQVPAEIELKVEAHQPLAAGSDRLAFDLPQAAANNIAPATVLIFAADNIELSPAAAEVVGLSSEPTSVRLPGRQQAPLVYRDLGGGEPARFVAAIRTLKRVTAATARARVRIDAQQIQIEQHLDYRVAHEPQRVFSLIAPSSVLADANPQVLLDDEQLTLSPSQGASPQAGLTRLSFTAPSDRIGSFQAQIRYTLPLRWDRREAHLLSIPLVVPVLEEQDQFGGQQIEFSLAEGMQIEPDTEDLVDSDQPQPLTGSALAYSWPTPLTASDWILESSQDAESTGIAISQMWAQTWLSPRVRQERAAFRLRADRDTLVVKIDRTVKQSTVQTAVDGRETPRSFRQPGMLLVTLPANVRGRECVLELSYTLDPPPPRFGLVRDQWRAAQIEDAQPPRRMFWQLVMPGSQHLLAAPSELAAEMVWPADRWFVGPRAVFDQRQLEAWIKATPQEPLPRGANEYLYGALSRWPTADITVVSRRAVVFAASSAMLVLGLLLIHVPVLRRVEFALMGLVVAVAGSLTAPEMALLTAQAAALGLAVVLAAAVWSWATARPPHAQTAVSPATLRPRESRSTRPPPARTDRSSRVTTTAPGHAAVVEVRP